MALGLRCKQNTSDFNLRTPSPSVVSSRVALELSSLLLRNEHPVSTTSDSNHTLFSEKNLLLVPVLNHARPYSTLKWKSSPFHDLAPILFMFFQSRIDASHACIVGHTVYSQHVRCGPCIDRMRVRESAKIIKAGDHFVL